MLGAPLGLRVIHIDALHCEPEWVELPRDTSRARIGDVVQDERWVLDGNYIDTLDLRLPRADMVFLLDLPKAITMPRVIRRWRYFRGRTQPDLTPGCPEKLDLEFTHFRLTRTRGSAKLRAALREKGARARFIELRSPRAFAAFVESL